MIALAGRNQRQLYIVQPKPALDQRAAGDESLSCGGQPRSGKTSSASSSSTPKLRRTAARASRRGLAAVDEESFLATTTLPAYFNPSTT
jgi:hypothetical protein